MSNFGVADMVAPLRQVLMKKPGPAMANADAETWHYAGPLTLDALQADHYALTQIIEAFGDNREIAEGVPGRRS